MPHDHSHLNAASGDKRVGIAIFANALLTVAQITGGIYSGSLALIADAIHNFSDMASLVIAFVARKIARRPADSKMTYGYGRVEIVAALINYTSLIIIGFYLIYEGAMRLIDPPEIAGWTVVVLGGVALIIDALTALLTYSMQKGSVNIRALFLHNLSDALASVAVIIGGSLILLYDIRWVDPAITICIAAYILYLSFTEIGGPIRILMLASPPDIDAGKVIEAVEQVDGVKELHHVHLWQMEENMAALDTHVVVETDQLSEIETIKTKIKSLLADQFNIEHTTLEFENFRHTHEDAAKIGHE
ncbi:cation diffusion facilitator family transporter [Ahrensia marina]|uniref:Cation diffusion facilitator family transporter n=1 Tax=Ahrensia marina TaxID=1514904 RepID=A0A0M9GLK6_9HYPH|nr:cation diffusion facilitator family transporter [Ahrensia marina]KPB00630.1 cation diffusion facilitator family transporter [Ahrensia marina]